MPPPDLVEARLALAARTAAALLAAGPRPIAIGVVGSTALGRCTAASDLDLVAILADEPPGPPVTSHDAADVRIDVEWLSWRAARADTAGGGWAWELRKAARLGGARALHDPGALFERLSARARALRPDLARYAAELDGVTTVLAGLDHAPADARGEMLRGALDALAMLVLLAAPCRYQKPKWTLDDLVEAGETPLAAALLQSYGIRAAAAPDAPLARARTFVAHVLARIGAPAAATLVAMGHAPDHAAESYVARTLADADDLAALGRGAQAHYVAGFAVRLAAALLPVRAGQDLVAAAAAAGLEAEYRACFGPGCASPDAIAAAHRAAAACAAWLGRGPCAASAA